MILGRTREVGGGVKLRLRNSSSIKGSLRKRKGSWVNETKKGTLILRSKN